MNRYEKTISDTIHEKLGVRVPVNWSEQFVVASGPRRGLPIHSIQAYREALVDISIHISFLDVYHQEIEPAFDSLFARVTRKTFACPTCGITIKDQQMVEFFDVNNGPVVGVITSAVRFYMDNHTVKIANA